MKVLFMTPDYKQVFPIEKDYSQYDREYFNFKEFVDDFMYEHTIDNVGTLIAVFGKWKVYIVEEDDSFTYQGTVTDLLW